jgi:hypothetical protein
VLLGEDVQVGVLAEIGGEPDDLRPKYTRPAWLSEANTGERLTTSAMIASLAGPDQRTAPAPFVLPFLRLHPQEVVALARFQERDALRHLGVADDDERLTTSAMIASLAGPDQRTAPAPFGHALAKLAEERTA